MSLSVLLASAVSVCYFLSFHCTATSLLNIKSLCGFPLCLSDVPKLNYFVNLQTSQTKVDLK